MMPPPTLRFGRVAVIPAGRGSTHRTPSSTRMEQIPVLAMLCSDSFRNYRREEVPNMSNWLVECRSEPAGQPTGEIMFERWYYTYSGRIEGPISTEGLKQMAGLGL